MATLPLAGGCHCGGLRYKVTAAPLMVHNCHCTNCQRIGGGAFSTNVVITPDCFEFVQGEPRTATWKSDAGNERFGWFCGDCGSRILHGQEARPIRTLRAGSLDDTSWVQPVADIWTGSAQPWVEFASDRLRCEGQPTDFGPYLEAFRKQGNFPD